jgi:hypothetical protein
MGEKRNFRKFWRFGACGYLKGGCAAFSQVPLYAAVRTCNPVEHQADRRLCASMTPFRERASEEFGKDCSGNIRSTTTRIMARILIIFISIQ